MHPSGLLTAHTLGGYLPEIVPAFAQLAEAVHAHGTRLFVQLFHGGREQIASAPRAPAVAPSAVPSLRFKAEPRALTVREIGELIDGYATAARHALQGGLDGVEVSMAHGYLPAQFFSAPSNRRDRRLRAVGADPLRDRAARRDPRRGRRPASPSACGSRPTSSPPGGLDAAGLRADRRRAARARA